MIAAVTGIEIKWDSNNGRETQDVGLQLTYSPTMLSFVYLVGAPFRLFTIQ
jgi:hypothetical protein